MKSINYSLIRTIAALIIGLVLVMWPDAAADYLVITIGILFVIPGILGLIGYFGSKNAGNRFPLESLGSFLLGLLLVIIPGFFVNTLMYILGFVLLLGGLQQLYSLIVARKWTVVPFFFFITPVLVLLAGLFIIFSPRASQRTIFMIIGFTAIVYAANELLNYFRFMRKRPKHPVVGSDKDIEEAEIL